MHNQPELVTQPRKRARCPSTTSLTTTSSFGSLLSGEQNSQSSGFAVKRQRCRPESAPPQGCDPAGLSPGYHDVQKNWLPIGHRSMDVRNFSSFRPQDCAGRTVGTMTKYGFRSATPVIQLVDSTTETHQDGRDDIQTEVMGSRNTAVLGSIENGANHHETDHLYLTDRLFDFESFAASEARPSIERDSKPVIEWSPSESWSTPLETPSTGSEDEYLWQSAEDEFSFLAEFATAELRPYTPELPSGRGSSPLEQGVHVPEGFRAYAAALPIECQQCAKQSRSRLRAAVQMMITVERIYELLKGEFCDVHQMSWSGRNL
ncbi:hypothetical protein LTR09_012154 [Extremus antarcticus]|uniref:Uncharacterized protein n=1 Tax=Extremus antarcticus TaxID=702011 RepID=A0AAJ0D5A2_9PEZI|nr:hypothetical protein LTR09_012154 [Extremus antarcticus]